MTETSRNLQNLQGRTEQKPKHQLRVHPIINGSEVETCAAGTPPFYVGGCTHTAVAVTCTALPVPGRWWLHLSSLGSSNTKILNTFPVFTLSDVMNLVTPCSFMTSFLCVCVLMERKRSKLQSIIRNMMSAKWASLANKCELLLITRDFTYYNKVGQELLIVNWQNPIILKNLPPISE